MTRLLCRTARRLLFFALSANVACSDSRPPLTPVNPAIGAGRALDTAGTGAGAVAMGRVVLSVRAHDAGASVARLIAADSGTYAVAAGGISASRMALHGGTLLVPLTVAANATQRQGRWDRLSISGPGQPERVVSYTAAGGAPPSTVELKSGGDVVARIETTWRRTGATWLISDRIITLFKEGRPARSIEMSLGEPAPGRQPSPGTGGPERLIVPDDPPEIDDPDIGGDSGPNCQAEMDALFNAIDAYWAADAALVACVGGPIPCLGAAIGVFIASERVDYAQARLDACQRG